MKSAIYPGSFDPITLGHITVVERGLAIFDHIEVVVGNNIKKKYLFSLEERIELINLSLKECLTECDFSNVSVKTSDGLIVDYAAKNNFKTIIRGLRAISDFEFEIQMANTNRKLVPAVDTIFFMTEEPHLFTSSTVVREIANFHGDLTSFAPKVVIEALQNKFGG